MLPLIGVGIVLFITGFIADPAWVVSYPRMLLSYQDEGNVSACSECASLPVWLSRGVFDGSLASAVWIAVVLLVILAISLSFVQSLLKAHELLLSAALLVTLLVSPYLYNYDYLLLLVPFAVLFGESNLAQRVILILSYLVPTFVILLFGRTGNISLLVVSFVVMALLLTRAKNPVIDFTARAA
jgi:hypothetical protein